MAGEAPGQLAFRNPTMTVVLAVDEQNRREGDPPLSGNGATSATHQIDPLDVERESLPELLE
jgi:hypothetical protein